MEIEKNMQVIIFHIFCWYMEFKPLRCYLQVLCQVYSQFITQHDMKSNTLHKRDFFFQKD